jgi:hypothetical protein
MKELEQILNDINWPLRDLNEESLKSEIKINIGFTLPDDYKFFLSHYQGYETFIKDFYIVLWDKLEVSELNNGYEIQYYLPQVLAIGSNGGGEMIGLHYKEKDNYEIILLPFGSLNEEEHQIIIGTSFTNFLERLEKGESWFK